MVKTISYTWVGAFLALSGAAHAQAVVAPNTNNINNISTILNRAGEKHFDSGFGANKNDASGDLYSIQEGAVEGKNNSNKELEGGSVGSEKDNKDISDSGAKDSTNNGGYSGNDNKGGSESAANQNAKENSSHEEHSNQEQDKNEPTQSNENNSDPGDNKNNNDTEENNDNKNSQPAPDDTTEGGQNKSDKLSAAIKKREHASPSEKARGAARDNKSGQSVSRVVGRGVMLDHTVGDGSGAVDPNQVNKGEGASGEPKSVGAINRSQFDKGNLTGKGLGGPDSIQKKD